MNFRKHSNLEGKHAFLGASKYSWLNYDSDKLLDAYNRVMQTQLGTELHDFASRAITLGIKLPKTQKTLNMFVNDAIVLHMSSEVSLYYSDNCFGTADAISFDDGLLRVHDLKTGTHPAHMQQLWIYDALFCLEYNVDPRFIDIENRIYQLNKVIVDKPSSELICDIMEKIIFFDKQIEKIKRGEEMNV